MSPFPFYGFTSLVLSLLLTISLLLLIPRSRAEQLAWPPNHCASGPQQAAAVRGGATEEGAAPISRRGARCCSGDGAGGAAEEGAALHRAGCCSGVGHGGAATGRARPGRRGAGCGGGVGRGSAVE
ncbi:hypothetical protein BRADI_1g26782v3 [Brachypodium distachyon]|uniref:Uncharacterized protein n=1 Tax=Brachypodium distachyon TaxID=15368 RepID=A0A2K2DL82_BRADI|nr:hypothetical protein BRADI_1g26782v3 [Brachypodium distachyon]